jgi:hypothetical protein
MAGLPPRVLFLALAAGRKITVLGISVQPSLGDKMKAKIYGEVIEWRKKR